MKKVDIVLTTWKRETITLYALSTLMKNTNYPYRLIIIDNGSDPYAQIMYENVADVYHKFNRNMGLEYAKNYAMQFVQSDTFISTDNDVLVPQTKDNVDWLTRLILLYESNPEYKAIALRPQILVGTGNIFGENPPEILEFSHVPGYMRIQDTALTNEVGAWSDKRELRGHEEYWISGKFRDKGYKVGWASNIHCYLIFGKDKNWGYGPEMTPEESGHNPVNGLPVDDMQAIKDFV